ncbi:hypothetical protein JZ785_23180 [Alicyclobacillus curvatus]|nr:hypothetical protein JZ785_23180 [Alicyclobacillus curvatus]
MNYYKLKFVLDGLMMSLGIIEMVLFPFEKPRDYGMIIVALLLFLVGTADLIVVSRKQRRAKHLEANNKDEQHGMSK